MNQMKWKFDNDKEYYKTEYYNLKYGIISLLNYLDKWDKDQIKRYLKDIIIPIEEKIKK